MTNYQPITKTEFAKKSWQRSPNYMFTSKDQVCELGVTELPAAMMSMPLAFLCTNGEYSVAAVQGLEHESNFYVGADGKWRGRYIPASYRGHPFILASNKASKENLILCIDTDSNHLIHDDTADPFFDKYGELSAKIGEIMEFLTGVTRGLKAAARICEVLLKHDLFMPWELELESELDSPPKRVEGLFCINEAIFKELSDEAHGELRRAGAIHVIYCQLLSMQNISSLKQFAKENSKLNLAAEHEELYLHGAGSDGNINFDNL